MATCDLGYAIQQLSIYIAVLIIMGLAIYALFELKRGVKVALSAILGFTAIFHYVYLWLVSLRAYECKIPFKVLIAPLLVIETTDLGGALYPDIGQIAIIALLVLWRRELKELISRRGVMRGGVERATQAT
jgi:hypothetical protein